MATQWMPVPTQIAAAVLALQTLALAGGVRAVFARTGRHQPAGAGSLIMGLLAAFVAYGRYALTPRA